LNALGQFKQRMTHHQKKLFSHLTTPVRIQEFIDALPYRESDTYRCPLAVLNGAGACCFEGALMAAAVLMFHGKEARIIEIVAAYDDDHVLALYKRRGRWGAMAKSNFTGIRSREPVFRTLRELVLSYFSGYYNEKAQYTLRAYTRPLDLHRFDGTSWLTSNNDVNLISDALDRLSRITLVTPAMARSFSLADERIYRAGILGGKEVAAFTYYDKRQA
jgi:hypothetical protein